MSLVKGMVETMIGFILELGSNEKILEKSEELKKYEVLEKKFHKRFKNPKRKEILALIKKNNYNIKQISEKINLSYTNTLGHIRLLEDFGYIYLIRKKNTKGREVTVHLSKYSDEKIIRNFKKKILLKISPLLEEISKEVEKIAKEID